MKLPFYLGKDFLTVSKVLAIADGRMDILLDDETRQKVIQSDNYVISIAGGTKAVYGINTGFGPLCNTKISSSETAALQRNLLLSHSVGVGELIDKRIAKIMLILKAHALCKGFSGVSVQIVERIIWFIRHDAIPAVPAQGSLGASGDLAPLSHLFLPLIGLGQLHDGEQYLPSASVLHKNGLNILELGPKDGLALINGTQFIAAHAVVLTDLFYQNLAHADMVSAMMIDALEGSLMPFHPSLHELRPFPGNIHVAGRIFQFLKNSEILASHTHCDKVQDPYSLRCIPQVHGASRSAWLHLKESLEIEINAVTDNPVVFNEDFTISGGNFHGQPLALPLDYACLALSEIGSISDRRMYLALEGRNKDVPKLLMSETGINSGFMILQYTAAALASENKTQCFPASADSIMTSLGQEDHVSMGSIGARKALKVGENTLKILAIELVCAAQALDFKKPLKSGRVIDAIHEQVRKSIPFAEKDDLFGNYIQSAIELLQSGILLKIEKEFKDDQYSEFDKLFEIY